jgi:hypothetical protein
VASLLPLRIIRSQMRGMRILVVAAPNARVGLACKFDCVEADHQLFTRPEAFVTLSSCYNAATALPSETSHPYLQASLQFTA